MRATRRATVADRNRISATAHASTILATFGIHRRVRPTATARYGACQRDDQRHEEATGAMMVIPR